MYYNHKPETRSLARDIIRKNAYRDEGWYFLDVSTIDEIDLEQLAACIMKNDASFASEATGSDNKHYDRMLLTLRKFLENPCDKEAQYVYLKTWRECVTDYFKNTIDKLIEWELDEYNSDFGTRENAYVSHGMSERDFR
jgi:hypothetical protein